MDGLSFFVLILNTFASFCRIREEVTNCSSLIFCGFKSVQSLPIGSIGSHVKIMIKEFSFNYNHMFHDID